MELQKPHIGKADTSSVYTGESAVLSNSEHKALEVEKVIRFLWDGNTILHEWEDNASSSKKALRKIDYQADYVVKLSKKEELKAKAKTAKGETAPESLVTWIFQDDFVPRAKITKDGCYSIMTDYMGTPVQAYDEAGNPVWERELDINGKVMPVGKDNYGRTLKEVGERNFIPFRFQGQYEDEEIGLYYNRFRYYDPETGQYTQQDPIGLAGGNPTLYGYVYNTLGEIDPFGLDVKDGVGRTHVTYRGIKNGLPYTGYASAPSSLNLTPQEIINRRYNNNFTKFGGKAPTPVYVGKDQMGKWTARGLEQRYYEMDVAKYGKDNVANAQNPVGKNNAHIDDYLEAADAELNKSKMKNYSCK